MCDDNKWGYQKYDPDDKAFFGAKTVVHSEYKYIHAKRSQYKDHSKNNFQKNLTGLALSGGGIRSASFCLGVMQALAHADWLKKIDYLSTVSGGGYIGSSISWLLH